LVFVLSGFIARVLIQQRVFSGQADLQSMTALAQAFPADNLHIVDLPYCLTPWAFDDPNNVGLWVSEQGELRAWAAMQTSFSLIDWPCTPPTKHCIHDFWVGQIVAREAH
jgi:hypothetical protein